MAEKEILIYSSSIIPFIDTSINEDIKDHALIFISFNFVLEGEKISRSIIKKELMVGKYLKS